MAFCGEALDKKNPGKLSASFCGCSCLTKQNLRIRDSDSPRPSIGAPGLECVVS